MTITITAFQRSPDGGKGLARDTRVRWALEEVGQPYEVRLVSLRAMKEPAHRALHPFGQIPTMRKAISPCSRQGRSCSISPSAMRACCRTIPMPGRARSHGCLPRSTRWSRRSLNWETPSFWRATSLGTRNASSGRGSRPCPAGPTFRSAGRRLARGCIQRGRLDDGVGAAQVEIIGHSGRISEPGRLCRPRRSPTRLQAGFRRLIGRLHRQATHRLIEIRPGVGCKPCALLIWFCYGTT